jgi:hypothetical protein
MTRTQEAMMPPIDLLKRAFLLANRAVVCDIESYGVAVTLDQARWYDVSTMLDPREHCDETIAMLQEAIDYALHSGVALAHPERPHLLRIVWRDRSISNSASEVILQVAQDAKAEISALRPA